MSSEEPEAVAPTQGSVFQHQPLKSTYLLYQLTSTLLVRLPIWVVQASVPSLRPKKTWGVKRTVVIRAIRHYFSIIQKTGPLLRSPNHKALQTDKGVLGEWISPLPDSYVVGKAKKWAELAGVSPVRLPGYWIHEAGSNIAMGAPPTPGEKVVYALHGGAYISLSAHPSDVTSAIARGMINSIPSAKRAFSIEYRLSSTHPNPPGNFFPTALLDALTGYFYLVYKVGFAPSDIILEGDSAGGNLALALVRYLTEYHDSLPEGPSGTTKMGAPGHVVLSSPWSDIGTSHHIPGSSTYTLSRIDYVAPGRGNYAARAFTGPHGLEEANTNLYMSPATLDPSVPEQGRFAGFPKTFIACGGSETLRDQIRDLHRMMKQDCGEDVLRYQEAEDCVHDFLALELSSEPERGEVLREIGEWVESTNKVSPT